MQWGMQREDEENPSECSPPASPKKLPSDLPASSRNDDSVLALQVERINALSERSKGSGAMCMTVFTMGLCVLFFMYCPKCMFGILVLSACLCPWFNSMNAPLWLAIILLTMTGWSFTGGSLSVMWNPHIPTA